MEDTSEESQLEKYISFIGKIYEYSPNPFTVCTSDGHILMCNSAFCALTGYTREELYQMDWGIHITPAKWHTIEALRLQELRHTGYPQHYEKEYIRRDGSCIPVELLVHLLYDTDGNTEYYYAFISDISARKQAEEARERDLADLEKRVAERTLELERTNRELRDEIITRKRIEEELQKNQAELESRVKNRTAELQKINDQLQREISEREKIEEKTARLQRLISLSTTCAAFVHEITQPVNTIKVIADGILYFYGKGRPFELAAVAQKLQKISTEANRINHIITNIRAFAGLGNVPDLVPCNINDVVNAVLDELEQQLLDNRTGVKLSLGGDLPLVLGNHIRLEQVVNNLLLNAIQAFDMVSNNQRQIICTTWADGNKVFLEIQDNATGISEEIRDKIFEPFISTKKQGKGTGLGLAIVQVIVTSFNGQIQVYNNKQGGASVRVELPAWLKKEIKK